MANYFLFPKIEKIKFLLDMEFTKTTTTTKIICTDIINSKSEKKNYHKTNTPQHILYLSVICVLCLIYTQTTHRYVYIWL